MEANRIILGEPQFSQLCKLGFITRQDENSNLADIYFNKIDIKNFVDGKIVKKDSTIGQFEFALLNLDKESLVEIVKRSPIFYELVNTL